MPRRNLLPASRIVIIAFTLCLLLSASASAQSAKISIKCDEPAEPNPKIARVVKVEKTGKLKVPKFEVNPTTQAEKSATASAGPESQVGVITKGCVALLEITAGPSSTHANQLVLFNVSQTNQLLGLRWSSQNPYSSTLQAWIQLDSNGFGVSSRFQALGQQLGTTTLLAESPGFDDTALEIVVVECNCPIIPVSSPPRN